jgi:hypothetical protein
VFHERDKSVGIIPGTGEGTHSLISEVLDSASFIQLIRTDEEEDEDYIAEYEKKGTSFIEKGIKLQDKDGNFSDYVIKDIVQTISDRIFGYNDYWYTPSDYHYFFPIFNITVHGKWKTITFCLLNWPTDDEYGFAKGDYIFFANQITSPDQTDWDNQVVNKVFFCTKDNLLDEVRKVLDEIGYLGFLPTYIDCMISEEMNIPEGFIKPERELSLEDYSRYESISLINPNPQLYKMENEDEAKQILYPLCTESIVEQIKRVKPWFDAVPFNIAGQLQACLDKNPHYFELEYED